MSTADVVPVERPLRGRVRVPGDKSISHRAAILGALAHGRSRFSGFSPAGDCGSSLSAVRALGAAVGVEGDRVEVGGRGVEGLTAPPHDVDCGRSGTTMRLLAGAVAAAGLRVTLSGHPQLLRRPMRRVAEPLSLMGAEVTLNPDGRPPMTVAAGGELRGIEYRLPVASAQVKSAVLLAGLSASGATTVLEDVATRDHTERLLAAMGGRVRTERPKGDGAVRVSIGASALSPVDLAIPGDLSSAAFLVAAAALVPGSDVVVEDVGLNPGRVGFLQAIRRMGGEVELREERDASPEPHGDLAVRHAPLHGIRVGPDEVPGMIDELPLLGLLATQAEGATEVRGAAELRVKESDRIAGLIAGLRALGADAEELPDGFVVRGPTALRGGACDARTDHRLAMTFGIAGLVASGPVAVGDMGFAADSFPGFLDRLRGLA